MTEAKDFLQELNEAILQKCSPKVIRFVSKSESERARLIREARAIYDGIFPPADPVSERQDKPPKSHTFSGANAHRSDGVLQS
jgi:hypothetical protein